MPARSRIVPAILAILRPYVPAVRAYLPALIALALTILAPVVQLRGAEPVALGRPTGATQTVMLLASLVWLYTLGRGALTCAERLLTLPGRLDRQSRQFLRDVSREASLPQRAGVVDELAAADALERAQEFREARRLWLAVAALQLAGTVAMFAAFFWFFGVRDVSGPCGRDGAPTLGTGFCDGHLWWSSVHLSVATITTLGYGDVQPLGVSRILADLEALTGLLYAGVFIAGLSRVLERGDLVTPEQDRERPAEDGPTV